MLFTANCLPFTVLGRPFAQVRGLFSQPARHWPHELVYQRYSICQVLNENICQEI